MSDANAGPLDYSGSSLATEQLFIHAGSEIEPRRMASLTETPKTTAVRPKTGMNKSRDGNMSCGARGGSPRLAREARGWRR